MKKHIREILILFLSLLFLFIDHRLTLGVLLGYPFAVIHLWLIQKRYNSLNADKPSSLIVFGGSYLGIFLLIIPLMIAVLLPQYFNFIGVLAALVMNRIVMIIEAVISIRESK